MSAASPTLPTDSPATRAAARWNELLAGDVDLAAEVERGRTFFAARGLELDGRPLCSVLRPHLLDADRFAHQQQVAALLLSALRKVAAAVLADRRLRDKHLGDLYEWIGHLIELEPGVPGEAVLLRLDASLARTRLHFLETNADAPVGCGHNDAIVEFFEQTEVRRRFGEEYELRPLRLRGFQLQSLLAAHRERGGQERARIGVVTRLDDPVRVTGIELETEYYRAQGVAAAYGPPEAFSFERGKLWLAGAEVDILHRVVLTAEFLEGGAELDGIREAVRAGAVCLANPFHAELLGHKALFALLSDPELDFGFSAAERAAIAAQVPWTRRVVEGRTTGPHGENVDLVAHLLEQRPDLVLKPAHGFGGHDVVLGWHQDDAAWEAALATALEADFVVQRRIEMQQENYPAMEPGAPARAFYEDTDPFLFGGATGGLLTRLGTSEITNVHAAGSVCASFVVGP
ncbi:MAG TPA: hypothetical protein VF731_03610 [Solirubrobacterales bacterium]